jgi:hypothetical protein
MAKTVKQASATKKPRKPRRRKRVTKSLWSEAEAFIKAQGKVNVSGLKLKLKAGQDMVCRALKVLERRGVITRKGKRGWEIVDPNPPKQTTLSQGVARPRVQGKLSKRLAAAARAQSAAHAPSIVPNGKFTDEQKIAAVLEVSKVAPGNKGEIFAQIAKDLEAIGDTRKVMSAFEKIGL